MKVYEIRTGGEKVWIAATDPISAIHFADLDGIIDIGAADEGDDIVEIPRDKWSEYFITDENGNREKSFAEDLAGLEDTKLFKLLATTLP